MSVSYWVAWRRSIGRACEEHCRRRLQDDPSSPGRVRPASRNGEEVSGGRDDLTCASEGLAVTPIGALGDR